MKYSYKHQGYKHVIELISDQDFIDKGHGEFFLSQFRKFAPEYEPAKDHSTGTYKMVNMDFIRKYGIKEE